MLAVIETIENDDERKIVSDWYMEYKNILAKIAYDYVGDYHVVQDLLNDAFVKIIRYMDKIMELNCSEQAAYFVSIIRSVSIDYLRKSKKESEHVNQYTSYENYGENQSIPLDKAMVIDDFQRFDIMLDLRKQLDKLSQRDVDLLMGKYVVGLTEKELGDTLGIKEQNVHVYVTRARNRLIKMINEEGK